MSAPEATGLIERARIAIQRRAAPEALRLLAEAEALSASPELFLEKALALRMTGNLPDAIAALDAALTLEPDNFLALLSKGALLERLGRGKTAAGVYRSALAVAPSDEAPPSLAAPIARAREVVRAHAMTLAEHLRDTVAPLRTAFGGQALDRFDEGLSIYSGVARAYVQEPLLLHYPRLPAIPFYERDHFPWLEALEAATPVVQAELAIANNASAEAFSPYIAYPPGVPVNQWAELNHSRKWSAFFLWRNGERYATACDLCPKTAALLASLPIAHQPDYAPTAMFSVLDARTRIPPHTGSSNTRLIVHLPLNLPGPARFRVGNSTRPWRMGEAWVFDDTIEHEAWNDADAPRTILIFDVWNPLLSEAERALISAMMSARKAFETET